MKMMKVLVALLVMAGLVAPAVAIAEDKLSISGEFRVFGFSKENYADFDDSDKSDETDYFNQRLRLYSKYAVTEGVTIHTRMDFGEGTWGADGQNSIRQEDNNDLQIDRAFLEIDKERFNFRAGQQYYGFGNSIAVDHQGTGFRVSTKGPVVFTAFWNKLDENGSTTDDDYTRAPEVCVDMVVDGDTVPVCLPAALKISGDFGIADYLEAHEGVDPVNSALIETGIVDGYADLMEAHEVDDNSEDTDMYGASLKYKNDNFAAELFYALEDNKSNDANKSVLGLAASTKLGAVNVNGELNVFDGDNGGATDYTGTQLYLDANSALSSALTLGGSLFYAQGDDSDVVLTELSDFGSWLPWEYGYFETNYGLYDTSFDPFNLNAGAISLMGYGSFKASDDLGFKASVQYGTEEDDDVAEYSYMSYNLSAQYMIAKNTKVFAQFNYLDVDDVKAEDSAMGLAAGIQANF